MSSIKYRISALPLAAPSQLLIHNLTPDQHTPSVAAFREQVQEKEPSLQRRARLLPQECHFSHVAPFPVPFPFDIEPDPTTKGSYIEKWLTERESKHLAGVEHTGANSVLRKYYPHNRDQPRELIGLSETGLKDCVPHLDIGDGFAVIGAPSLSNEFGEQGEGITAETGEGVAARQEIVDILSGNAMLMSAPEENPTGQANKSAFAPWSLRYSGHQFGSWAGQLGDGRAISILVTPHPSNPELSYELQLKGAGRTPFSRSADGLAVLRSSIREYLCSEAMQALKIPTTRSLSLISLPALPVARERMETACVLTRMAPSFLRIGSFEALNGPTGMYFFGGGQQPPDLEALRVLGEWTVTRVLKLNVPEGQAWGKELVLEVARRNAVMVAGWQAYGFMHGVINTDNVSILGLTIDYGPYAFMDVFDPFHICNHTDESGRYAYKYQPSMIIYALRALLNALAPLIGAEEEAGGKALSAGWSKNADKDKIANWTKTGIELRSELERVTQEVTSVEYGKLMRKRLGLRKDDPTDETHLFKPLLDIMETYKLDFHSTFRNLADFNPSHMTPASSKSDIDDKLHTFISRLLSATPEPEKIDFGAGTVAWLTWLEKLALRIEGEGGRGYEARRDILLQVNPRFVLRQWVLEEVIAKVERDADSGKRVLAKVMQMACNPFEPWGAEGDERPESELSEEEREERRYCSLGDKKMLGFQCSCSS